MPSTPFLGRLRAVCLPLLALSVSACSGGGAVTGGPEAPAEPEPSYPAYESFDPAGYEAEAAPAREVEIVHDVPANVMAGRVVVPGSGTTTDPTPEPEPERGTEQVEGYRVQVYASESRQNAERVRGDALRWWATMGRGDIEAIVAYLQPYYRVRLGAFASREEADAALSLVRREFPEAFLVPDVVTVER